MDEDAAAGTGTVRIADIERRTASDIDGAEIGNSQAGRVARVDWHLADLGEAGSEEVLGPFLDGVDAVVHLAWALQPGRRPEQLSQVNVEGTRRVVRAAVS